MQSAAVESKAAAEETKADKTSVETEAAEETQTVEKETKLPSEAAMEDISENADAETEISVEATETVETESGETVTETEYTTEKEMQTDESMTAEEETQEPHEENAAVVASGNCGYSADGLVPYPSLKWEFDDANRTLTISLSKNYKSAKMKDFGIDPYNADPCRMTQAPWNEYRTQINTIEVKDGVESIGLGAFAGLEVRHVNLPSSLKTIEDNAFIDCYKLEEIMIPYGVTKIGYAAFVNTELKNVSLPATLTELGEQAFAGCKALEKITLPNRITYLDGTFDGCSNLRDVTLPQDIQIIGTWIFKDCTSLKSIIIPDKVEEIEWNAFNGCTALTNITLPDSLLEIGDGVFGGCTSLKSIKIPQNVATFGEDIFKDCSSDLTLLVYENSKAHQYAKDNNLKYKLVKIDIFLDDITLNKGETKKLTAKIDSTETPVPEVKWESSDPSVASISNGNITGNKKGTCTVTAECGGSKASCTVTVMEMETVSDVYSDPVSGTQVTAGTQIELKCDTAGAQIYYTENGTDPSANGKLYTGKITVTTDLTIKAIAKKSGFLDSKVTELRFYIINTGQDPNPGPEPSPGQVEGVYANYMSGQNVPYGTDIYLYCDTPDATIYYTLNSTDPTTGSAHYTGPITINRDMVIKAFAVREGYTNSEVSVFYFYVDNDEPVEDDEVLPEDILSTGVPSGMWVAAIKDQCFTGTAIKPEVHVYEGRKRLYEKKDYIISYRNNVNKGTAEIVITGKGNYKDKQSAFFNITIKDITAQDVTIDDMAFAYDGKPHKVVPTITYNGKKLKWGRDYKVEYGSGDYTQEGTYYTTVHGVGNYMGKVTQVKTVILDKSKMISKASVIKPSSKDYNDGKEVTLSADELQVVLGRILTKDKDYTVKYINNINPGTATVVIKGMGEYAGTKQVKFKIVRKPIDIALATVTYSSSMSFTKGGCVPEPKVVYKGERLRKGIDYTVSYSKNKKVGNAVMIVKGKGRFIKSKTFTFVINQKSLENVVVRVPDILHTGKANTYQSKPVLTDTDGRVLTAGTDYTIQGYSIYGTPLDKSSNPSAYSVITVKLSGKGNYRGDISATYTLKQGISIGNAKVSVKEKTYTGKPVTLSGSDFKSVTVKIKKNEANLIYGRDYTIVPSSYTQNILRKEPQAW